MAQKPNKKPVSQAAGVKPTNRTDKAATNAKPAAAATTAIKGQGQNNFLSVKMLCIILGVISIALYANTLMNGYVMDDVMVLRDNTMVTQGMKAIPELLATPHMRGYLVIPNDLYRPLSLVMLAAEYQFFGATGLAGYHLFNVLIFAGCVIMLFLFLVKFFDGKKTAVAFIAALIFAVHPIHTEVVANIKSLDELLCFFFAFMSLNLFANYMKGGKMAQLVLGVFTLFLSYISKETVIAFVVIIPFLFFFYINDDKKRAAYITAGMAVATVIFLAIRVHVLSAYDANQPSTSVEFIDNALSNVPAPFSALATKIVVLGMYLKLMFLPHPLLCTYSFDSIHFADFADWRMWVSLLAYGGMIWFAVKRFMKNRKDPWTFCIIFYLTTLFLFSNLPFLMGAELAERFAFFASTGFCLAAALAAEQWLMKGDATNIMLLKSVKVLAVLVPISLIFGGLTVARNFDWKNNITLYKADIVNSPEDCRLYHNVGSSLAEDVYPTIKDTVKQKEIDNESIGYLRKGLAIFPDYADIHVEMGRVFDRERQYDSAAYHDERALQLNPINFTATNNLGSLYLGQGKYEQAAIMFKKAMALNPNFKYPYINLARTYQALKKYDSALINYRIMESLEPTSTESIQGIGVAYFEMQRWDSALYYFNLVLKQSPDNATAVMYQGASLLNAKQYAQSIEIFKKMLAANPNDATTYSNLVKAYYLSKQYDLTIAAVSNELTIDPKHGADNLPYIALSYEKKGDMANAKKYEALAKQRYSNFKLE